MRSPNQAIAEAMAALGIEMPDPFEVLNLRNILDEMDIDQVDMEFEEPDDDDDDKAADEVELEAVEAMDVDFEVEVELDAVEPMDIDSEVEMDAVEPMDVDNGFEDDEEEDMIMAMIMSMESELVDWDEDLHAVMLSEQREE
jgi:hypothetical protein